MNQFVATVFENLEFENKCKTQVKNTAKSVHIKAELLIIVHTTGYAASKQISKIVLSY